MNLRSHWRAALPFSLLLLGACGGEQVQPNVLLIVVDTLRADHLSCYGYERATSPHIDRLAAEGWRFENAISPAPWTTPSLGALFTSKYPSLLGIENDRSVVADELLLLPEVLQEHGYATGAVVSHSFCSAQWGFSQGFDSFDESNVLGHAGVCSPGVTEDALEFLDQPRDRPFFLWLHYFDPHNRYVRQKGYAAERAEGYDGRITPRTSFRELKKLTDPRPADVAEIVRYYDSEIAFTDHHIGRVLERLAELGLDESTIVVFVADHGEEFFEHGRIGHAHSLYQELVRVPLILRVPGEAPRVVEETVATIDLYPTLLELLDIPAPDGLEGGSLLTPGQRPVFSETSRHAVLRSVVQGRRKLVRNLETGELQAFDLTRDSRELEPGPADDELAAALEAWIQRLESEPVVGREIDIDPELLRELEDLGYTDDGDQ